MGRRQVVTIEVRRSGDTAKVFYDVSEAFARCLAFPGHYGLIVSRHYRLQSENAMRDDWPGAVACDVTVNRVKRTMNFPNGSVLRFDWFEQPNDTRKYQGTELSFIYEDYDSYPVSEEVLAWLNTRVRRKVNEHDARRDARRSESTPPGHIGGDSAQVEQPVGGDDK